MQFRNMAGMGLRVAAYHLLRRRCPVNVMLAVTNRCNCRCRYCQIPARPGADMPTDRVLRLIDEMAAAGTQRLGIWGGEPLVRDDIGRIVSHAAARGLYVTMDTNGLLWPRRAAELGALGHAVFALDGARAGHEANRGEGTFDGAMAAIEDAVARPRLKVWTLTVLTRHNLGDIDFLIDTARRLRIHCAFQILHHNDVLGRSPDGFMPSDDDYRAALAHLKRRKREGAPISCSTRYLDYLLSWGAYTETTRAAPHRGLRCKAGALYCNVDAEGSVYACSLLVGKVPAQNALAVGFRAAFDAIPPIPCQACTATCFTEYNYLYDLDPVCVAQWLNVMRR